MCKLLKSLYGLKQAPRQWFAKPSSALKDCEFVQSKTDYSLFIKEKSGVFVVILAYVDDLIVTGNNMEVIIQAKQCVSTELKMKDLGELMYFLCIEVDKNSQGIFLSQRKYVGDLLH